MSMDRDRHPCLGPRRALRSEDECLAAVRAVWPGASAEGSTGMERSWVIRRGTDLLLVAHHWSPGTMGRVFYLRIADPSVEPDVW